MYSTEPKFNDMSIWGHWRSHDLQWRAQYDKTLPLRLACFVPFLTKKDMYFDSDSSFKDIVEVKGPRFLLNKVKIVAQTNKERVA